MTHNIFKVGNIEPNANGALSISPNDLSDLGTYADGETLVFNATAQQWQGGAVPSGGANSATFGRGEADDYLKQWLHDDRRLDDWPLRHSPTKQHPCLRHVQQSKQGLIGSTRSRYKKGCIRLYASIGVFF